MPKVSFIVIGDINYIKPARQFIEYYYSCGCDIVLFTTNYGLTDPHFYNNHKNIYNIRLRRMNLLIKSLS